MRDVAILGVGMTPVGEHWGSSLKDLAAEAGLSALHSAGISHPQALYVGNSYSSVFGHQSNLGVLIADFMGLDGIETFTTEAGDASGGAALRCGYLAIASGIVDTALVIGVEKSTDVVGNARNEARNISLDNEYEASQGATLPSMAALLMQRYMYEFDVPLDAFEGFSVNAHANGKRNKLAMYRNALREGAFAKAPMIAEPVSLFDSAPDGDGAAAIVLVAADILANDRPNVLITGSAIATDTMTVQDREDMFAFSAVQRSSQLALQQAEVHLNGVDVFELHDAFTIFSVLSLEAMGLANRGDGWRLANEGGSTIALYGKLPLSTFGGLKSRGNPAGATGIYQAAESYLQLTNQAGKNQVLNANTALIQNLGGVASTAVTHILQVL